MWRFWQRSRFRTRFDDYLSTVRQGAFNRDRPTMSETFMNLPLAFGCSGNQEGDMCVGLSPTFTVQLVLEAALFLSKILTDHVARMVQYLSPAILRCYICVNNRVTSSESPLFLFSFRCLPQTPVGNRTTDGG